MPIYSTEERDNVIHAITQVLEFFDKPSDAGSIRMWLWAFQDYDANSVIEALRLSIKQCEFAPRPAKIIKIIEASREQRKPQYVQLPESPAIDAAPDNVARAWTWLIRQWGETGKALYSDPKLSEEEVEEALVLVNEQSKARGEPTSIPEHCFLQNIWGCTYEEATRKYARS